MKRRLLLSSLRLLWLSTTAVSQQTSSVPSLLGQTVTYGNNTYVQSWLAPTAVQETYFWVKDITPTVLGTVYVVIDNHNRTVTKTSTRSDIATEYQTNGTLSLLTRSDVNAQGTVTSIIYGARGQPNTTLVYPTAFVGGGEDIVFNGLFPERHYFGGGSAYIPMTFQNSSWVPVQPTKPGAPPIYTRTCCNPSFTTRPTPSHYPWASSTGTVDAEDPTGWLYNVHYTASTIVGSQAVSSLYAPGEIDSVMQYCPYARCPGMSSAAAMSAVASAAGLLVTSTVHITSSSSSTTNQKPHDTQSSSASVLVDPFSTSNPPTTRATSTHTTRTRTTTIRPTTTTYTSTTVQSSSIAAVSTSLDSPPTTSITPTTKAEQTTTPQTMSSSATPPQWYSHSTHNIYHRPTKTLTATPIEVGSAIITPNSNTEYIVFSQTLSPGGPPITVSGTRLSLGSGATLIVEGSKTEVVTTKTGIGGYIWEGIGGSATTSATFGLASSSGYSSTTPSVAPAQPGSASAQRIGLTTTILLIIMSVLMVLL